LVRPPSGLFPTWLKCRRKAAAMAANPRPAMDGVPVQARIQGCVEDIMAGVAEIKDVHRDQEFIFEQVVYDNIVSTKFQAMARIAEIVDRLGRAIERDAGTPVDGRRPPFLLAGGRRYFWVHGRPRTWLMATHAPEWRDARIVRRDRASDRYVFVDPSPASLAWLGDMGAVFKRGMTDPEDERITPGVHCRSCPDATCPAKSMEEIGCI